MPWCHDCGIEYEEGREKCARCGRPLEDGPPPSTIEKARVEWKLGNEQGPPWPEEDGQPVRPVLLTTIGGSQIDFDMTISLLNAYGVPVVCGYPESGRLVKIIMGFTGAGMQIFVPETMEELAKDLLNSRPVSDEEDWMDDNDQLS